MTPLYRQPYRPVESRTPRSIAALHTTVWSPAKNISLISYYIGITPVIKEKNATYKNILPM